MHSNNAAGVTRKGVSMYFRHRDELGFDSGNLVQLKVNPHHKHYTKRMNGKQVLELNLDGDGRFWNFKQDGSPVLEMKPEGRPNPDNPAESLIYFTPAKDDQGNLIGGRTILLLQTTTTTDKYGSPDFDSKDATECEVEILVTTAD